MTSHFLPRCLPASMAIMLAACSASAGSFPGYQHQAFAAVLLGEIALQRGLAGDAWQAFTEAARVTGDARLAERAWEVSSMLQDKELGEKSVSLWDELDPENTHAALLAVEAGLHGKGDLNDAGRLLSAALGKSSEPEEILSRVLESAKDAPDKRAFYNWLLPLAERYKDKARTQLVLARAARDAKRNADASGHARRAYEIDPEDPQTVLESADIEYPYNPKATSARLKEFLGKHPENLHLRLAYARSLQRSGTPADVLAEVREIDKVSRESPHTQFALGMIAEDSGLYSQAELFYKRHLVLVARNPKSNTTVDAAYVRLGMVKLAQKRPDLAVEWFGRVEKGDQYVAAKLRQSELLAKMKRIDEACSVLRGIRAPTKEEKARFCSACADLLISEKRLSDAFDPMREAAEAAPDNPDIVYKAGMAADAAGNVEEAERLLTRATELAPENATAHNGLGFVLADRNIKLEKAAYHIEKAMELSGGKEGFIVDSLGWLRYRQGRLEEAERELRRAHSMLEDDEVVLHLSEVLFARGKKAEAEELARSILLSRDFGQKARDLLSANGIRE